MSASWIVEPIDVFKQGHFYLPACLPCAAPDKLGLKRFEESLHNRIIVTIPFAAHGYLEAIFVQLFLVIVRAILASTVCMVDAVFGRLAKSHGHVQCPDGQIALHAVADSPADHTTRVQIQYDSEIQPALIGPDVGDITRPLLVGCRRREVSVQQIGGNGKAVVTVSRNLEFPCPDGSDSVLGGCSEFRVTGIV